MAYEELNNMRDEIQEYNWQWVVFVAYATIFIMSLWIRSGFPVYGNAGAMHDDMVFQYIARQLLKGEWLGPYNNLTLIKGMFYPLFIAVSAVIGVPLKIAEHILYLFCSFLIARYVSRVAKQEIIGLVLFGFLTFNPIFWTNDLARVLRDGVYTSLSMALVFLVIAILFPSKSSPSSKTSFVVRALATGVVAGCYWLTREEGIWLLPVLIVVALMAFIQQYKLVGLNKAIIGYIPRTILLMSLSFCLVVGGVRYKNWCNYKLFETTEFHTASFLRAYGTITRIHQDSPRRYVVFPKDARNRAYSVSGAALELKPYLDGDNGNFWKQLCDLPDHSEIHSGVFVWALRDAAALSGHYKSGDEAMAFYDRLANEINTARNEGRIESLPSRVTLAPIFKKSYIFEAIIASKKFFKIMLTLGDGSIGVLNSIGTRSQLEEISDLVGPIAVNGNKSLFQVHGWVASKNVLPQIDIVCDQETQGTDVTYSEAEDIKNTVHGFNAIRFEGKVENKDLCSIRINHDNIKTILLKTAGTLVDMPDFKIYIEDVGSVNTQKIETERRKMQQKLAKVIAKLYSYIMPILFPLGLFGILFGFIRFVRTWHVSKIFILALASLIAIFMRMALLSYMEVTMTVGSINVSYASPASPFMIICSILGSFQLFYEIKLAFFLRPKTDKKIKIVQ